MCQWISTEKCFVAVAGAADLQESATATASAIASGDAQAAASAIASVTTPHAAQAQASAIATAYVQGGFLLVQPHLVLEHLAPNT